MGVHMTKHPKKSSVHRSWFDTLLASKNPVTWGELYRKAGGLKLTKFEDNCLENELASRIVLKLFDEGRLCFSKDEEQSRRKSGFFVQSHHGQGGGPTGLPGERQMVLAMFNMLKIENLGEILDYEIPLQSPRPKSTRKEDWTEHKHGKIDLLAKDSKGERVFLIEAKDPDSKECGLRVLLEINTYLKNLAPVLDQFRRELSSNQAWSLTGNEELCPVMMTFKGTHADRELLNPGENFAALIKIINNQLAKCGYGRLVHLRMNPFEDGVLVRKDDRWCFAGDWDPAVSVIAFS